MPNQIENKYMRGILQKNTLQDHLKGIHTEPVYCQTVSSTKEGVTVSEDSNTFRVGLPTTYAKIA